MNRTAMFEYLIANRNLPDDSTFKRARWITTSELYVLYTLLQSNSITRYFECGTANGFSTLIALKALQDVRVASPFEIHTFDPYDRPKLYNVEPFKDSAQFIQFHQETFDNNFQKYLTIDENIRTGFFIDGDHSLEQVTKDWNAVANVMQENDLVVFHDLYEKQVRRVFNTIVEDKKTYRTSTIVTERVLGVVTKVPKLIPEVPEGFVQFAQSDLIGTGGIIATAHQKMVNGEKWTSMKVQDPLSQQHWVVTIPERAIGTMKHLIEDICFINKIK